MRKLGLLAALLLMAAPLALAQLQGTYQQIDYPGAAATVINAIDTGNDLSGWYQDASGVVHGWILKGPNYYTVDYPGATSTQLLGMNDYGQLVGEATPNGGFEHDANTGAFSIISYPGAAYTHPNSINDEGEVAGYFGTQAGTFGFVLNGSSYTKVVPRGATDVEVNGISYFDQLSGWVYSQGTGSYTNFIYSQGKYQHQALPPNAVVNGIDMSGDALVGFYPAHAGNDAGFLSFRGTLTTLEFPGASYTVATATDEGDEVAGYFADSSGVVHGFTWSCCLARVEKK